MPTARPEEPTERPEDQQLTSWKEIAAFFDRDVRTVSRWEKELGLPVHRHLHQKRGSVYAYRSELEAWRDARQLRSETRPKALSPWLLAAGAALLALAGLFVWMAPPRRAENPELTSRPITSLVGEETQATFSPDGKRLAFVWNGESQSNFDIYTIEVDGLEPRRLTDYPLSDFSPAWSPDGRYIAFLREETFRGPTRLMVRAMESGEERELLRTKTIWQGDFGSYLTWTPDGRFVIAPLTDVLDGVAKLHRVSVETGESALITDPPATGRGDSGPEISPDGHYLAFCRLVTRQVGDLYIQRLTPDFLPDGAPVRHTELNAWVSSPRWLPDGRRLLFASGWLGATALWTVEAFEPTQPERLPMLREDLFLPTLSPDGSKLVFSKRLESQTIWTLDLDEARRAAGSPRRLIASSRPDTNPDFSSDGQLVAFDSRRSGTTEVWICARDGSDAKPVTKFGGALTGSPRWSPDGRRILFDSRAEGQAEIYIVDAAGGEPVRLTSHEADDLVPTWSRDGRTIYFGSKRSGSSQVWRQPVDGDQAVQVTESGGLNAVESPDGKWLYFAKLEWPSSLWRVPVSGGSEEQVLETLYWYNSFHVAQDGIYFIPHATPHGGSSLQYLDLATRDVEKILDIEAPVRLGLAVSPDERTVLFVQADHTGSDLILAEGLTW